LPREFQKVTGPVDRRTRLETWIWEG